MANVEIEKRTVGDKIEIQFKYVYEPAGADPKKNPAKFVTGAFSVKKNSTGADIKAQIKGIINELISREKSVSTKETLEVSLA